VVMALTPLLAAVRRRRSQRARARQKPHGVRRQRKTLACTVAGSSRCRVGLPFKGCVWQPGFNTISHSLALSAIHFVSCCSPVFLLHEQQRMLREWEEELMNRPEHEARTALGRQALNTHKQCKDYMRPFFRMCKRKVGCEGLGHARCVWRCGASVCNEAMCWRRRYHPTS